ncbi:hypothetical protein [Dyella flagellata]|nr:hypothetical protein [Dyella flagellata]
MSNSNMRSGRLPAAVRFVTWILPPHRRDWAEAMLNEMAYAGSHRAALLWVLGCTLFAIRARTAYELERTFMSRRILRALLGISAASVIAVVGVYAIQKPYQRERILLYVFHGCNKFGCPRH